MGEVKVYVRWAGTRICFGALVKFLFILLGVDDINVSLPYDKVCGYNSVGKFPVLIPGKIGAVSRRLLKRRDIRQMVY